MTNKTKFDNLIIKHYKYLLLTCRKYLGIHKINDDPESLLSFCILQVYNKIDSIDKDILDHDAVFKSYMYMVIKNQTQWQTSPYNKESKIISSSEEVNFDSIQEENKMTEIEFESISRDEKNNVIDLINFGVDSEDLHIYNKIQKVLDSLKAHEKILLDEYILKGKSVATIRSTMKVKPSTDFLYKTIRDMKQRFKTELNINTTKNKK